MLVNARTGARSACFARILARARRPGRLLVDGCGLCGREVVCVGGGQVAAAACGGRRWPVSTMAWLGEREGQKQCGA